MEITRQADYYSLHDDDAPVRKEADFTPEEMKRLLAGPQIQPGLLNY